MVVGPDVDYFWILARQPTIDDSVKTDLLKQARTIGIAVDDIIWVAQ
jgi:apolipoprotein D and lipocalin family protein